MASSEGGRNVTGNVLSSLAQNRGHKRKQIMPKPGSNTHPNGASSASSNEGAATPAVTHSTMDLGMHVERAIKAVKEFEQKWSEEFIRSCAAEMKNKGKIIDAATLYNECTSKNSRSQSSKSPPESNIHGKTHPSRTPNSFSPSSIAPSNSTGSLSLDESSDVEVDCAPSTSGNNSRHSVTHVNRGPDNRSGYGPQSRAGLHSFESGLSRSSFYASDDNIDCIDGAAHSSLTCVTNATDKHSRGSHSTTLTLDDQKAGPSPLIARESPVRGRTNTAKGSRQNLNHPQVASLATSQPISEKKGIEKMTRKSSVTTLDSISKDGSVCNSEKGADGMMESVMSDDEGCVKSEDSSKWKESTELEDAIAKNNLTVAKISPELLHFRQLLELVTKEHELLEIQRKCIECKERSRDITFLPCGHFTVCSVCSEPRFVCQLCNRAILGTVTTYLS